MWVGGGVVRLAECVFCDGPHGYDSLRFFVFPELAPFVFGLYAVRALLIRPDGSTMLSCQGFQQGMSLLPFCFVWLRRQLWSGRRRCKTSSSRRMQLCRCTSTGTCTTTQSLGMGKAWLLSLPFCAQCSFPRRHQEQQQYRFSLLVGCK